MTVAEPSSLRKWTVETVPSEEQRARRSYEKDFSDSAGAPPVVVVEEEEEEEEWSK